MAWTSNTKNGWVVMDEEKTVAGPFKEKSEALDAMAALNEPPTPDVKSVEKPVKKSNKRKGK